MTEPTPEELRERIAAERAELGRTAAALADRVDVGSRARAARDQATEQVRTGVAQATEQVKVGVGQATEQVKAGVGQAQQLGGEVLDRTAGAAKQAVGNLDSALGGRDRTRLVAAGFGAALFTALLVVLRRRRT
ncbi:DUF3618 domain-containing protein [Pseudonocardia kujensis]|uniref:DUF3618 domain-containing protein n=1 Tax=Pseudonocardia kujensis TaxID=1128675 RepID=UPI001E29D0AF|nr:DUF3618 domain-containing protein [Pseudonocardia kujensis]MCE0767901.1 DUF3618 domain-containing protein [Pseudonocardia kujensis]